MAVYYVKNGGSDAASGLSDALAWETIAKVNASSFSAGDSVLFKCGSVWRERLEPPSSGSSGNVITFGSYSTGAKPIIKGSADVSTASYSWTLSGSGTNEYYLRTSGGGDPGLYDPDQVFLDDVLCTEGTVGSLADHEWDWGDNDTLGYSTIYLRDNSGDPDTSGVLIEAGQHGCVQIVNHPYITFDGLEFRHASNADGGYCGAMRMEQISTATHITVQNCEAHWCVEGIALKGSYNTADNCIVSYVMGHSISIGGATGEHSTYCTISDCLVHHSRADAYPNDYGIKLLYADDCSIYRNEVYECGDGIDLDGSELDEEGSSRNLIYENYIHDNKLCGLMMEWFGNDNQIYRNRFCNNGYEGSYLDTAEVRVNWDCLDTRIYDNIIYKNKACGDSPVLVSGEYMSVYGNTIHGHGYVAHGIIIDGHPEGTELKNNIIIGTTDECIWIQGADYTDFVSDYNCYRRSDSGQYVISSHGYTGYTCATHCSNYSLDCNSMDADPMFVDADNGDYTLLPGSPCIDAGVDLGATYQNGLMPGSTWPDGVVLVDRESHDEV